MTHSPCVLCGANDSRVLYRGTDHLYRTTNEIFSVVKCLKCGMARMDPRPTDLRIYYPPLYWFRGGGADAYRRLVIRDHVRFAFQALASGTRVLDAGSGGGLLGAILRERGIKAYALDVSCTAAALAARDGVPSVAADFANPPFRNSSWDVIAMFHMLEHVPDPRQHLQAAHRLLTPSGRLVIAVPNFASFQRRLFGTRWNGIDLPRHIHHFRARDLSALLQQTGFRVIRTRYFSWRDSAAGLATTLAPALDPMARAIRGRACLNNMGAAAAAYAALTAVCLPFAALEAATRRGSVVLMQAERL